MKINIFGLKCTLKEEEKVAGNEDLYAISWLYRGIGVHEALCDF